MKSLMMLLLMSRDQPRIRMTCMIGIPFLGHINDSDETTCSDSNMNLNTQDVKKTSN